MTNTAHLTLLSFLVLFLTGSAQAQPSAHSEPLWQMLDRFEEQYEQLRPMVASYVGNNRYNHRLENPFSQTYREATRKLYSGYLDSLRLFPAGSLSADDRLLVERFRYEADLKLQELRFQDYLSPINQMDGFHARFVLLSNGSGIHPFKTPRDYADFLSRTDDFVSVTDSAVAVLQRGVRAEVVAPRILAQRVLGQLRTLMVDDVRKSTFYQPITNLPTSFTAEEKQRLTEQYEQLISQKIMPALKRFHTYLEKDYLPHCRETSGLGAVPGGKEWYAFLVRKNTTTSLTPDEIHRIGLREVARIRKEIEQVQRQLGYEGDLKSFFNALGKDPRVTPFRSDSAILNRYTVIHQTMMPSLNRLFNRVPVTRFEVRATDKFRAASSAHQYVPGLADGSRPAVFYVPIPDPATYQATLMESLFLHEAIPGHHYQMSLQSENANLPRYRKAPNLSFVTFIEGWALYTESLGKELGLYTDPYQYLGRLQNEIHRAVRLVVDTGIHAKSWSREEAIRYSMEQEGLAEYMVVAEIERYMANPGQALSYKIGELRILANRQKAEKALGNRFDIRAFHDHLLMDGSLPLELVDRRMDEWIAVQKQMAKK